MGNNCFSTEGKIISNSFSFEEPSLQMIHDPSSFIKSASKDTTCPSTKEYIKNIKTEPGRTKLLALFLGAGEYYGANKNGDWFSENDLIKCYPTFKKHGFVYKHHKNKDPEKKFGDIEFVTWNNTMKRVEGIMSLIDELCYDELEKIDAGEDIPVSMAAKLKYDICSDCGNKARSMKEYCDHLKHEMRTIRDDGRMVYAINPNPVFFDISIVYRPADRTAYVLKKVASELDENQVGFSYSPKNIFLEEVLSKKALLNKMSELEKKIEGLIAGKIEDGQVVNTLKRSVNKESMADDEMSKLKKFPIKDILSSSIRNKILLSLKEFLKLFNEGDKYEKVCPLLNGGFSRMLEDDVIPDMVGKDSFFGSDIIDGIFKRLSGDRKLDEQGQKNRIVFSNQTPGSVKIITDDNGKPIGFSTKTSKSIITIKKANYSTEQKISNLYNAYKFNFLAHNPSALNSLTVLADNYFI